MRKFSLILVASFFFLSCNRNVNQNIPVGFSQSDCVENESKDYLLCVKTDNPVKNEIPPTQYSIQDREGNIIQKGSISRGTVSWLDNDAVQILEIPGIESSEITEDDITRVYNVKTGKIMSKTEYLKLN